MQDSVKQRSGLNSLEQAIFKKLSPAGVTRNHAPASLGLSEAIRSVGNLSDDQLAGIDVAFLNLLCAVGLPGAEELDIECCLGILDEWSEQVESETKRNYPLFLDRPEDFRNSQAYYCVACMVHVLRRQLGVKYNPKWTHVTPDRPIPDDFGRDAKDGFIHAIIDGIGGVCGSLPFLYVAVGRRLGYPLKIFKAARHLVVRWDDADGTDWLGSSVADRFNVEATAPGIHCLSDEEYRTWPGELPEELVDQGIYLKSLSPREELAECLATRGYVCRSNRQLTLAIESFRCASRLWPTNPILISAYRHLTWLLGQLRGDNQGFINAPNPLEDVLRSNRESAERLHALTDTTPTVSMRQFGGVLKIAHGTPRREIPQGAKVEFVPESMANWPPRGRPVGLAPCQSAADLNLPPGIATKRVPAHMADLPPANSMMNHGTIGPKVPVLPGGPVGIPNPLQPDPSFGFGVGLPEAMPMTTENSFAHAGIGVGSDEPIIKRFPVSAGLPCPIPGPFPGRTHEPENPSFLPTVDESRR